MSFGDELDEDNLGLAVQEQYEDYATMQSPIDEILDDCIIHLLKGRQAQLRQELRSLGQAAPSAFRFVSHAIQANEEYHEVVQSLENEKILEAFERLNNEYAGLHMSMAAVYLEINSGRVNPVTSYDSSSVFNNQTSEPMVSFEVTSGDSVVFETTSSLALMAFLSRAQLTSIKESLESAIEQNRRIDIGDYEMLLEVLDEIEEENVEIRELLDGVTE